jgi:hypothetical protein
MVGRVSHPSSGGSLISHWTLIVPQRRVPGFSLSTAMGNPIRLPWFSFDFHLI